MMAISIKEALKPLLPRPVLERWQRLRFNAEQAAARDRPLDHVFNEIYAKGMCGLKEQRPSFTQAPALWRLSRQAMKRSWPAFWTATLRSKRWSTSAAATSRSRNAFWAA